MLLGILHISRKSFNASYNPRRDKPVSMPDHASSVRVFTSFYYKVHCIKQLSFGQTHSSFWTFGSSSFLTMESIQVYNIFDWKTKMNSTVSFLVIITVAHACMTERGENIKIYLCPVCRSVVVVELVLFAWISFYINYICSIFSLQVVNLYLCNWSAQPEPRVPGYSSKPYCSPRKSWFGQWILLGTCTITCQKMRKNGHPEITLP